MTEERKFTEKEMLEIVERYNLIAALEHAITMGKQRGDSPTLVNPLINLSYQIQNPPQVQPQKPSEPESSSEESE